VAEVSPEAAVGGPLALVENGDEITIDADARTLDSTSRGELARRREPSASRAAAARGYLSIYQRSVQPMSTGAVLSRTTELARLVGARRDRDVGAIGERRARAPSASTRSAACCRQSATPRRRRWPRRSTRRRARVWFGRVVGHHVRRRVAQARELVGDGAASPVTSCR
jgi:hypothetical protein